MFCISPKIPVPLQSSVESGDSAGKRSSVKDGFSEIFDRSMHALQRDNTGKQRSGHSADYTVSSLNAAETRLKVQTRAEYSDSPPAADSPVEGNVASGNEESVICAGGGEQNRTETTDIKSDSTVHKPEPDDEPVPEPIELLQRLQQLLSDILMLLQSFYQSMKEQDSIEKNPADVHLEELKQQILLKLTEAAELIKTSELPELENAFAGKLLQVIENGLFEAESVREGQISIEFVNELDALVRKMLSETKAAKLRIAGETLPEVTAGLIAQNAEDIVLEHAERTEAVNTVSGKPIEEPVSDETKKNGAESETDNEAKLHQEQSPMNIPKVSAAVGGDADQNFVVNAAITPADIQNETASAAQTADKTPAAGLRQMEEFDYQIIRQVIEKAETLLSENRTEMVIRLKPESLGKLTLRIIHERGGITAGFIAENEQVKAVIESNLRFLEDSLRRSGVELQSLAVSVGQNGQGGQNEDGRQYYSERAIGRKMPVPSTVPVNDMHHIYRFGDTSEGLIQMERPAIDLTA
ncbi:MAG TPA: flagellar hook-length control protein FliK [Clostridia bacterium]